MFTVFCRRTQLGQEKQQECHLPPLLAPKSYTGVPDQGNLHHTGPLAPKKSRNIILAFLDSSETGRHVRRRVEWMLKTISTLRGNLELGESEAMGRDAWRY